MRTIRFILEMEVVKSKFLIHPAVVSRNLKTREKSDQKTKNTLDNLGKLNIDASNNCYTKLQLTNQNQKAFRKYEQ